MSEDRLYALSDEELEREVLSIKEQALNEEQVETTDTEVTTDTQEVLDTQTTDDTFSIDSTPEEVEEKVIEETAKYRIRANGQDYEFTLDELQLLAPKAMDYTKKMQSIAPYRKTISAMEENGISADDINLLIDIKKGNKEALGSLVKALNIDVYDIPSNEENSYTPTQYGQSDTMLNIKEVMDDISRDPEFTQTQQVMKSLDQTSLNFLMSNPDNLQGLHFDVKNGIFGKVFPEAQKKAAIDGYKLPILDYYIKAGNEYYAKINEATKANIQQQAVKAQEINKAKEAASLPQQRMDKKSVINYLDDEDDEAYMKWYKSLGNK